MGVLTGGSLTSPPLVGDGVTGVALGAGVGGVAVGERVTCVAVGAGVDGVAVCVTAAVGTAVGRGVILGATVCGIQSHSAPSHPSACAPKQNVSLSMSPRPHVCSHHSRKHGVQYALCVRASNVACPVPMNHAPCRHLAALAPPSPLPPWLTHRVLRRAYSALALQLCSPERARLVARPLIGYYTLPHSRMKELQPFPDHRQQHHRPLRTLYRARLAQRLALLSALLLAVLSNRLRLRLLLALYSDADLAQTRRLHARTTTGGFTPSLPRMNGVLEYPRIGNTCKLPWRSKTRCIPLLS